MLPLPAASYVTKVTGLSTGQLQFGFGAPILAADPVSPPPLGALAAYDSGGLWYVPLRVGDAQLNADAVNLDTLNRALLAAGIAPSIRGDGSLYGGGATGLYEGSKGGLYG